MGLQGLEEGVEGARKNGRKVPASASRASWAGGSTLILPQVCWKPGWLLSTRAV